MPSIWIETHQVYQDESLLKVCRSARARALHNIDQKPDQKEENHIDMVNVNSINFNSNHSIITADLEKLSNEVVITVPYKIDRGSNGSIMSSHIFRKLLSRANKSVFVSYK